MYYTIDCSCLQQGRVYILKILYMHYSAATAQETTKESRPTTRAQTAVEQGRTEGPAPPAGGSAAVPVALCLRWRRRCCLSFTRSVIVVPRSQTLLSHPSTRVIVIIVICSSCLLITHLRTLLWGSVARGPNISSLSIHRIQPIIHPSAHPSQHTRRHHSPYRYAVTLVPLPSAFIHSPLPIATPWINILLFQQHTLSS